MSSIPEERNIILQKNIPKLITSLTSFKPGDENFKICLNFAWSQIKHHRYLSVNSHQIKRDIEGVCEKFKLNSFHDEEKQFRKIVEESLSHELAVDHYEKDVMYGIISMLINLAYDPITKMKNKKRCGFPIFLKPNLPSDEVKRSSEKFINSLLRDNFDVPRNEGDSDLSDWTESEDEELLKSLESVEEEAQSSKCLSIGLRPPQKIKLYEEQITENAEKWLKENIQHSWWSNTETTSIDIVSTHPAANFNQAWELNLSKKSMGLIKPQPTSLLTEYCLLREILWMFINPVDCKFFKMENDQISLRANVSIPSTTTENLHIFLKDFVSNFNILHSLNKDIEGSTKNSSLSHTLEKYYSILNKFLSEISQFIIAEEEIIKAQLETYTMLILHHKLRQHMRKLNMLWNIHKNCILRNNEMPHIQACYLIASLSNETKNAACKMMKNLCIIYLVKCLKTYLDIFDIWWTEARLQDLKNEFIVEKMAYYDNSEIIQERALEKCKEKSIFISDEVGKRIINDFNINTMRYFAKEASYTLEIISKLDRIHEMKQMGNGNGKSLYEKFIEKIQMEIAKFSQNIKEKEEVKEEIVESEIKNKNQSFIEDIKKGMIEDGNDLMLMIFNSTFDSLTMEKSNRESKELNLYEILNNSTSDLLLPLERSIERILRELLEQKISIAEKFVIDIYLQEFMVEENLQEIRKIFFLDSSEFVNYFSIKIFPLMESGDPSWANPYILTTALNEITGNSLFTFNVDRKIMVYSVFDAIDEITLFVNVKHHQNLENILTSNALEKYNDVFRFLLKIKWAQRTLYNLLFPEFYKQRSPYAKMCMLDLVIKRLSITRFSMLQAINTIHNRIMVTLQGLSHQFDSSISNAKKITELISHHNRFVDTCHRNAFMHENNKKTRGIIIEMLKLAKVIKDEWNNVETFAMLDAEGKIDDSISLIKLDTNSIEIDKAFKSCVNQLRYLLEF